MRKKTWDYIQMGIRSKENSQQKRAEEEARIKEEAKAFNKTFTDKTYSVAKKVIENVEKVSNYDYEKLFDRVKHDLEDKINSDATNVKVNFTLGGDKNKNKNNKNNTNNGKNSGFSSNSNVKKVIITPPPKSNNEKIININPAEIVQNILKDLDKNINNLTSSQDNIKKNNKEERENLVNDIKIVEEELKPVESEIEIETEAIVTKKAIKTIKNVLIEKVPKEKKVIKVIEVDTSKEVNKKAISIKDETIDEIIELDEEITDEVIDLDEEITDEIIDLDEEADLNSTSMKDKSNFESSVLEESSIVEEIKLEDESKVDPVSNENKEEKSYSSTISSNDEYDVDNELKSQIKKDNKIYGDKYYKRKRREKFAKKMKVELDDTLIVQKKRSLTRLFKFSLAFKLSFVFIFLMMITVVTLSVGFYFGIDYVVELKNAGKLEDIKMFKDVLLILLIIFNLTAILLYVSVGAKSSRGLVKPLDEMTKIVKQINGEAMDRRLNVTGMHDELKELALTFNEMLERIELAYETQNRFTSDASHELRTPIAVIQGYVNMLDRWGKADGEVLDESIEAIKSEANNMKRLTEKLLLLAKADKGILEMNFEEFSLKNLIEEITRETHMIDSKHEISNEINAVDMILGDRPSLKQALRIFVDNSVKYTPEGGKIAINAYHRKKGVNIEISDNGIGISEEDMKQVFNRFYRADPSRTKASGGHGLGLSIAKWIVKEHKGEIEIKSEVNKGTVVTIFLSSS